MGVESDQLVFDYLSRVGDLAQTALPAAQRMRLVAQLRTDIDRERGGNDNPAAVRRILGRIGSPDEVVEAAAGSGEGGGGGAGAGAPSSGASPTATEGPYGPYAKVPKGGAKGTGGAKAGSGRDKGAEADPDWWRVGPRDGRPRAGDELAGLPGMTGGVFIPFDDEELAEADDDEGPAVPKARRARQEEVYDQAAEDAEEDAAAEEPRQRRRLLPRRRGTRAMTWGSPLLLLAAALLVAGAAIGSWIPLGLGWLAAYLSRGLTRTQAKFAVLGIPGMAAGGMMVWLWGRDAGKWSTPIAQGQMGHAMQDAYPTTVRVAAVASALYLLWRSRRPA